MPKKKTPLPSNQEYEAAMRTIGLYWSSHARGNSPMKMTRKVKEAYRISGRYTYAKYTPGAGHKHPGKSSLHRLGSFNPPEGLPKNMAVVTRNVDTTDNKKARKWTSVYLEERDEKAGIVRRYRPGLQGARISIRGLLRGRGSASEISCDWRKLTADEQRTLHPVIRQFLDALSGKASE